MLANSATRKVVLHVALNPITGVWSVMRDLAGAQARSGLYSGVGLGIVADATWPALCRAELKACGLPVYSTRTPKAFGTAQFLWQRVQRPALEQWLDDLVTRSGADEGVIHFHNAWLSGIFLPLRRRPGGRVKPVVTFHGVNGHFRRQPVRRRIHRWIASRLDRYGAVITSVDHANLSRAETILAMDTRRFRVVPNGIGDIPARACPRLKGAQAFTVGHVGGMTSSKGWRILLEAAKRLRSEGLEVKVVLAGGGPEAEEARQLAKGEDGWLDYQGFVANPRESVMTRLDALVLMSDQEGLPMAIIEALSVGLPVIATAVGGVPEAVTDGRNGFLVERSVEALASALKRLAKDTGQLQAFSHHARSDFEDRFEISKIVSRYDEVYAGTHENGL